VEGTVSNHALSNNQLLNCCLVTGYIENIEPLDYRVNFSYTLDVEAEDCGHRKSNKLVVNIAVKAECKVGWKGIVILYHYYFVKYTLRH